MDLKVKLDFKSAQHIERRVGLINPNRRTTPAKSSPIPETLKDMCPKSAKAPPPAATTRGTSDEDIARPPEESSEANDTDDGELLGRTTMSSTVFKKGTRGKETQATVNAGRTQAQKITNGVPAKNCFGIATGKQRSAQSSQQGSRSASPAKRKSQETGSGKTDLFGDLTRKKPKKKQSSQSLYGKAARSSAVTSSAKSKASNDHSPKKKFMKPDDIPDSDDSEISNKGNGDTHLNDSGDPSSSLKAGKKFKMLDEIPSSPATNDESPKMIFKMHDDSMFSDELANSSPDPPVKRPSTIKSKRKKGKSTNVEPPSTQMPVFNAMDDLGDIGLDDSALDELAGHARALLSDDDFDLPVFKKTESDDEALPSASQQPRCPFCKLIVDAAVLKKFQGMTTREQEKFCQVHQKEDAKAEWDKLGFPTINWIKLDSRIDKHHTFVRKLINGQDSHYRAELQAKVDEGKDRNLLKATANLTPGYYGGRGLRVLSENIMNKHTDLIKKRAPKDTLMSARGVTGFVQSVLVPEVATLLIKEDMKITIEEARELLADSAKIGELVHEEIREVVRRPVEDSDEDDDFHD